MLVVSSERTGLVRPCLLAFALLLLSTAFVPSATSQITDGYDPSWYDPSLPWVKIEVAEDGIYEVTGSSLAASGIALAAIDPATLKLYERGIERPLAFIGDDAAFDPSDRIQFVGRRNTGEDEDWAYYDTQVSINLTPNDQLQSSDANSLYTKTTIYWLTWTGDAGLRYEDRSTTPEPGATDVNRVTQTFHRELDFAYYDGDSDDSKHPYYTHGEGRYWWDYVQNSVRKDSTVLGPMVAPFPGLTYINAQIEVRVVAGSAARRQVRLKGRTWNNGYQLQDEKDWTGYGYRTLTASIPQSNLYYYPEGNQVYAEVVIDNASYNGVTPNKVFIDWMRVTLLRNLSARNGKDMFPSNGSGTYRYLLNAYTPNTAIVVLDPVTGRRYSGTTDGDGAFSFGDAGNGSGRYWTAQPSAIRTPTAIRVDAVRDWAGATNAADYLIVTPPGLRTSAEAYADFHTTHHGYQVEVVDLQDVFDQFDYGRPTPVALRRFFQQTRAWSTAPRYALLWGDARYPHPDTTLAGWEVPSYGVSSSDSWYVQGVDSATDREEFMAIGRIPLRSTADANLWLQKATRYVEAPFSEWQQRAYFLTGGVDTEQTTFQIHARTWAHFAGAEPAGQDTSFFFKTSNSTLDTSLRDSIRVAIRRGSSTLSYFGHSSSQTWEIVTDAASEFDNAGRLPFVLSLGCRTGAFGAGLDRTTDVRTLSESLLLDGESGGIGHWGSSELGTVGASSVLGRLIYEAIYPDSLRVIGDAVRTAKNRFVDIRTQYWDIRHSIQYNLIGDPGLRLNVPDKPDFRLAESLIRFSPQIPLVADSTITMTVNLRNQGYIPADSLTLSVTHTLPDGQARSYEHRLPPFAIADTLSFSYQMENLPGPHRFSITADPGDEYEEMLETNNTVERTHIVFSNGLSVVAPEPYGITSTRPRLRVSIANQDGTNGLPVRFELDTVPTFDSANFQSFNTTLQDAHADWTLAQDLSDATVYFWRARVDDGDPEPNWASGQFTVSAPHADTFTWMQRDALWLDNEENLRLAWTEADGWSFVPYGVSVFASSDRSGQDPLSGTFLVNNQDYLFNTAGYGLLVIDGDRGNVKLAEYALTYTNQWGINPVTQLQRLVDNVAEIETGDYFFVRTRHLGNTSGSNDIPEEVREVFRGLGSVAIDTLAYNDLWIIRGRKGVPSEMMEWAVPPGPDQPGYFTHEEKLYFSFPEGESLSPRIGPSQDWGMLEATVALQNPESAAWVDVLASDGETVLLDSLDLSAPIDLSGIAAGEHPYLRLRFGLADPTQQSTPQLTDWRVQYAPIPELVVDGAASTFPGTDVQEGEATSASIVIRNLSDFAADTAHVAVQITDDENTTSTLFTREFGAIAPDAAISVDIDLETLGLVGTNVLSGMASQPERTERIIYNNAFVAPFTVLPDRTRPVLEVEIDGQRLENDPEPVVDLQNPNLPFVTMQPLVEIAVSDENPYLRLDDPSAFQVMLDQRILTPDEFEFTPASAELNEARIRFEPNLAGADTVHTITVRAFDATGNAALVDPTAEDSTRYQAHFRVQNELQIDNIYPYPNPMSRRTRLMFLMRGSDASIVDDFRIRIYTVSGRLVREFDILNDPMLLEAGGLKIGWNSIPWDGTDEDGDAVASGVYLYKIFLRDQDGQELAVNNPESLDRIAVIR